MASVDVEKFCSEATNRFRERTLKANKSLNPSDYELELVCMRLAPHGKPMKAEFCLNCFRYQWPDYVQMERNGYSNFWLKRMVNACFRWKMLLLLGSASSGKSFCAGAYAYTMWKSSPWNTSVYLSTTSIEAGEARIWGTIRDLHDKDAFKTGTRLDYRKMIVLEEDKTNSERDYRDSIAAIAIKPGSEGRNAIAAISGRKNENVLWCCDEISHMDVGVLDARLNLLANPFSQFIGIGNKPRDGDPLYIDGEPRGDKYPDGWRSVTPDDKWWTTQAGACYYFDGEKSPNMQAKPGEPPPFPRLMTEEMRANIEKASGGRDTIGYWTQVKGFPNSGEVQDTVLNINLIEANGCHLQPVWSSLTKACIAGLDLGFRADGDPCVADFAQIGKDAEGRTILGHETDGIVLRSSLDSKDPFEDQIARRFIEEARSRGCHEVMVDVSGDGGITAQALSRQAQLLNYKLTVHLCSFMGTPDKDLFFEVGGQRKEAKELFDRKVSQLWYSYRISVQNGVIRGLVASSKAVKQLCQRKVWMDDEKRYVVETKKEMKVRIKRSPDEGDSRCLVHFLAVKHGLSGAGKSSTAKRDDNRWRKALETPEDKPKTYSWKHQKRPLYSSR